MGTTFKTKKEKFDYLFDKQKSVVSCIILALRSKGCFSWETGLSCEQLKQEVERRRGKPLSKQSIYDGISLINQYGETTGVYVRSGYGYVINNENKSARQFRYFIPKEQNDVNHEKRDLDHRKEIILNKENHIDYHERVTIPQEKRLSELRNQ